MCKIKVTIGFAQKLVWLLVSFYIILHLELSYETHVSEILSKYFINYSKIGSKVWGSETWKLNMKKIQEIRTFWRLMSSLKNNFESTENLIEY